jgi:hypothetical protein
MNQYLIIVKADGINKYHVTEYSNNEHRIRFRDETGAYHNYPEHWTAIIMVKQ